MELLSAFDLHLKRLDPELYGKMVSLGYSNVRHAWPSFRCFFSDILNREQFVQFMDHVVAVGSNPFFFISFFASYVVYFKAVIFSMKEPEQLDIFFSKQNAFPIKKLLAERSIAVDVPFNSNFPLAKSQY